MTSDGDRSGRAHCRRSTVSGAARKFGARLSHPGHALDVLRRSSVANRPGDETVSEVEVVRGLPPAVGLSVRRGATGARHERRRYDPDRRDQHSTVHEALTGFDETLDRRAHQPVTGDGRMKTTTLPLLSRARTSSVLVSCADGLFSSSRSRVQRCHDPAASRQGNGGSPRPRARGCRGSPVSKDVPAPRLSPSWRGSSRMKRPEDRSAASERPPGGCAGRALSATSVRDRAVTDHDGPEKVVILCRSRTRS